MVGLSWLSLLGGAAAAALCAAGLVLCLNPRKRREVRLAIKRNLAFRSKMYNELGLSLGNKSLQAFGAAYTFMNSAWRFPYLNAAFELGIFDLLLNTPMSAKAVAEKVEAKNQWAVGQLLQHLASSGIIFQKVDESGEKLFWHNMTKEAIDEARMTQKMKQLCNYRQYEFMTESIREGDAIGLQKFFPGSSSLYHARELYPEVEEKWAPWMEQITDRYGEAVLSLDLSEYRHMLDWCGSYGYNSIKLCKKYPGLSATVLDLPKVAAQVPGKAKEAGLDAERVKAISVNLAEDTIELPSDTFDCVLMCNCVIEWHERDLLKFFTAIKKALRPGGKVMILSTMEGPQNTPEEVTIMRTFTAYFICCADGASTWHKSAAIERLLRQAGFGTVSIGLHKVQSALSPTIIEAS